MPRYWRNFLKSLVAVLVGNAIYFLLMPHLPVRAQHRYDRLDFGLVIDFWICVVIYGAISTVQFLHRRRTRSKLE
jgi:putative flippase GtrA